MKTMHIKEIAAKLNITPRTIRFYEEKGLVTPLKQQHNDYRLFTEQEAWRLQTVISLREVGLSIDEIRQLLQEIDEGEQDNILHSLELQRAVMFAQLVELKGNIDTIDKMIELLKQKQLLAWEDIFRLAEGSKRLRDRRKDWRDRWGFDEQAAIHDQLVFSNDRTFNTHPSYEKTLQLVANWVDAHHGEKGLDIGTGTGNLAGVFLSKGIEMAAIDQSREMLKQCQRKFPSLETKLGNFLAIPYLEHTFDFIVSSYAFHHLAEDQKLLALAEMKRVLKPYGRICIADLMFENQKKRREYLDKLLLEEKTEALQTIKQKYYADRSVLLEWFEENGYMTKCEQITDILHIIYAVPIKSSY